MDIGSILLILGLFILVTMYIARPLVERKAIAVSQEEHDYSALLAERDAVLTALQELDFDYALGKIPEEDYPAQRQGLLNYGADVLRRVDAHQGAAEAASEAADDTEQRLEAAIAARRADARRGDARRVGDAAPEAAEETAPVAVAAPPSSQDERLEALLASRRRARTEKASGFCPKCGKPVQQSDRFCPRCGAPQA